jgi:uncharacterized membrane-anchored protein
MNPEDDPNLNENRELDELRQRVAELEQTEADRLRREQDAANTQKKRDLQIILFLVVSPLLLEAFFFVLNRSYMSTLFQDPNLPYGFVIQVVVLILALISFFTLRSSLSVLRSGRVLLGWVMGLLAFLLFILPAWMLVFMAPAALILLGSL